ncbi:AraC family transcriptional regulator ligand-binding domain-containing protein [Shimia sp. SDUM112013]|uniref:helix-turn-helix transcriptional regulator n=1 Tax=Shimia sp. SDUM112013 TaxID=3136160 RepID=UPI0032F044C3
MTNARGMGPLPKLVEQLGGNNPLGRVFQNAGLPMALIEHRDQQIPMAQMVELFSVASRELGDPLFGLRVGQAMDPGDFGMWTQYATQAPTLREAILRLGRTRSVHQNMGEMHLVTQGPVSVWVYSHAIMQRTHGRAHADHILPVMLKIARIYLGDDWMPEWVQMFYSQRNEALQSSLGCLCLPSGPGISLAIPNALLDRRHEKTAVRPLTSSDVFAEADAKEKHAGLVCFEGVASMRLLDGLTDIDGMAETIGCSRRTLQRALEREGMTYRQLLDRVRQKKANSLLLETDLTITEIALQSGYSDPAHFSRAFKRWNGLTPQHFRSTAA